MATNMNSSPASSGMGESGDYRSSDHEIDPLSESLASNEDSAVTARKRKNLANLEPDIKKLKLNYEFSCEKGAVPLLFGQGDVGQLGLGESVSMRKKPALVKGIDGLTFCQVAAGGMHTVLLTDEGEAYSFGCNDEGALGRATDEGEEYLCGKVSGLEGIKVVLISAGDSHTAYLASNGSVFVSGTFRDNSGLFGLQDDVARTKTPVLIHDASLSVPAIKIVSGNDHLALLTQKGEVLTLGNAEQGQLGRVAGSFSTRGGRRGKNYLLEPKPVHFPRERGFKRPIVTDIFAGSYHTIAVASGSMVRVYAWGLNNYGQLCLGNYDTMYIPTRLDLKWAPDNLSGSDVQFAGGQHHLLIAARGKVYVCGRGHFGTLGLGSDRKEEVCIPEPITALSSVDAVSCGSSVSYARTKDGKGYAWGMGTCYQLTTGDDEDAFEPVLLTGKQLENKRIVAISSGGQHTALLVKPIIPDSQQD